MTITKRRNRFLLCGSGSSGTLSPRSSSSNSSSTSSNSSGFVRIRLGFSTRLQIFFRRILSRFRSNRKRIHPNRQSGISVMEDCSLSIIMELPEHPEPLLASGTEIAPSPRPFSAGVQKIINRLSVKNSMSSSSRGHSVQSVWSENENVSPTAADLSPQLSISNVFDVASLSPEPQEDASVDHQISSYVPHEETTSEDIDFNKGQCRNDNAKQREKPISLMSSTAPCGSSMGAVVEKTKGGTDTMKMENKIESKSVQFQNNVIVHPSPSGRVDAKTSGGLSRETVKSLSDRPSEGLRMGEDCKSRRPATPGKICNEGEETASPPQTLVNEGEKTVSLPQTSTSSTMKDSDYTPRTPRHIVIPDSDKGKTNVYLSQSSAYSQQTNKTPIEEPKGELYAKEVDNSSALDNDTLSNMVCAKRSLSRVDISSNPTTSENTVSGEERNEKGRMNMSDVNGVDTDRQELEEKVRRRADRKKRKEMRMAAEGYIKEPEISPPEVRRKKKSKKKGIIQNDTAMYSEEPVAPQEYGQQTVVRLEAERDQTNLTRQQGSESNGTFEDKLQHWEKMKRKGDIRILDCQEGTNRPAGKTKTKKKKNREPPAFKDEGMIPEREKKKERTHTEREVKKGEVPGFGEEGGEWTEPMEQSLHHRQKSNNFHESRNIEDTVLNHSIDDYNVGHSKIGQTVSSSLGEVGKEKLSQEERRKRRAERKKRKEAIAAAAEISNDKVLFVTPEKEAVRDYPDVRGMSTQMSREDRGYQREHAPDQDKMEGMQQEIEEILGLSGKSDKVQKQGQIMSKKGRSINDASLNSGEEHGCGSTEAWQGKSRNEYVNSENLKSEDLEAFTCEGDSATDFQKGNSIAKPQMKIMNVTCGERIHQQKSRQKRKVKNFKEDEVSIIKDEYAATTDSLSQSHQLMNEAVMDFNYLPLTSSSDINTSVPNESNKKYVDTGVGPTPSENVSQKAVCMSKTIPVNVACGERHRKSSNKKREQRDNSTTAEVNKGYKESPHGCHLIGQQYSVDRQHLYPDDNNAGCGEDSDADGADLREDPLSLVPLCTPRMLYRVRSPENHLLMAKQDNSSLESPGTGGNGQVHYHEGNMVNSSPSMYPRDGDVSSSRIQGTSTTIDNGDHAPSAQTRPEGDNGRQLEQVSSQTSPNYETVAEQDRPRPVGCDVDINLGKAMNTGLESVVRRINQSGTFNGSTIRPESRSLWSTSTMNIPHSIQEEDETEESEELEGQTGRDLRDSTQDEDETEESEESEELEGLAGRDHIEPTQNETEESYRDAQQDNHIKYPAPGPREELAPTVFKVDKMNLPPVCLVQEDTTSSASVRNPGHNTLMTGVGIEQHSATEDNKLLNKQRKVDAIQSRTSPELNDLLAEYGDLNPEVEMRLIPDQTWKEVTQPIGHFRPKAKASADLAPKIQGRNPHLTVVIDDPSKTNPAPTMLPANLNRQQRAHYEKLTFRAPEKNLPGARFWKDLNSDKLVPGVVSQELFIKTPFGHIFPNESEDKQMSPIKAYCEDRSRISDAALDETGYESMEQSENYDDNSPESLSDLRNKLRTLGGAEVDSDPQPQSPPGGTEMNEVSTDPRFWKSNDTSNRDLSRLSAEVLSRIDKRAAQNNEMLLDFMDGNRSYQDEQFHEENAQTYYKEPSYAPSLTDRYHLKKEENLDFFRCVSRATQNNKQTLETEEENIARSFARNESREHTLDEETADGNLLFFKTVARYPEFYEQEIENTDSMAVKSRCGRRSPGYIPDDPGNYISGEVAHRNLEFFRAVARDTSFFKLPDKKDVDSEEEDSTPPRNKLAAGPDPPIQNDDTPSLHKDRSHQHTKMKSQKPASKIPNRFQYKTPAQDDLDHSQQTGSSQSHPSKWYSNRSAGLNLLQPVVSPGKAKENMDFFLQVSKDPHFYKIAEKPEPAMVAPDIKPKSYKTYNGINVNSGRHIGKQGLGFRSRH